MGTTISAQLSNKKNRQAIRWYVLALPGCHRGLATGLQAELERRNRTGETLFEYFAPTFVEVKEVNGQLTDTKHPLLYNYVFVHASESEIYRMKQRLPQYNFLPRVKEGKDEYHYPYLTDEAMQTMQWIARSYSNSIPVYAVDPSWLVTGDRIRITQGQFKNIEAHIMIQPRTKRKDVMVCIDNWMWVPLLRVNAGQYEIIELNTKGSHLYTHLNNDRLQTKLHEAMSRLYGSGITEEDTKLATEILLEYANLQMDSDVMRCKLYSLLLPAYTILGDNAKKESLMSIMQMMLPAIKAEQSSALLMVTLYGCTDSSIYYDRAHAIIDSWRTEAAPKKSKQQLIQRLDDYDLWLGHQR